MSVKVLLGFCLLRLAVARPPHGIRAGRSVSCSDETEYVHGSICCLNCPAGQYVKAPCTEAGKKGTCEECDDGTFTEHANGLKQCIKCARCPPDQEIVMSCTHTQDTVCRCKAGRYCHPDEACETCTKCSRCGSDEVIVKNCTSTSNTECKKVQPKSASDADNGLTVGLWVAFAVILCVASIIIFIIWRKKCRGADSDSLKQEYVPVDNSTSLTHRPSLEEEPFPNLVPVEGVESLKKCFDFFEELNMDFHKRFFRQLSLNDNVIKSRDHLPYEDRIHELLNHWVEKEGINASLNELLKALLDLNQRRTAEMIMQKAIQRGYYLSESLSEGVV
ncbi:hematopoietic death receptor isoform X2 [Fundulus heteroclitus]|uniref:hematopoietic death receptor isoform X2 n=1 Tax=Fundulus heteroclitus TaxID=8078 RepID=UPI00165C1345|nr:hematopoietic death receptor isoform X2 [Fundulus heteroclitus]